MNGKWLTAALAIGASTAIITGCTGGPARPTGAPAAAETSKSGIANPAAAYCQQQGYRYEIRTAADGGQQGFCVFPDGSECEEWAFYRGECKPAACTPTPAAAQTPEPGADGQAVEGWPGTVLKQEPGDQIGPYFQREDGQRFSIGSSDPALSGQIAGLRGTGTKVKVWGKLYTGVPADQARHIEVERLETVQ